MKNFKELIQAITGMSDEQYDMHVTDTAVDYLKGVLEFDQWGREQLIKSDYFWTWWNKQWDWRNEKLVSELALDEIEIGWYKDYREVVTSSYFDAHQITTLNIVPNKIVLERSFGKMIGKMIDGNNKKEAA